MGGNPSSFEVSILFSQLVYFSSKKNCFEGRKSALQCGHSAVVLSFYLLKAKENQGSAPQCQVAGVSKIKGLAGPFQHILFKFLSLSNTFHILSKIFSPLPPPTPQNTLTHSQLHSNNIFLHHSSILGGFLLHQIFSLLIYIEQSRYGLFSSFSLNNLVIMGQIIMISVQFYLLHC